MVRAAVIRLIGENPSSHGVFNDSDEIVRDVFAEVRSVGMKEAYTAMSQGLNPSYVFVLQLAEDYQDERELYYESVRYKVIRTYMNGDGIEITAERVTSDV